MASLMDAIFGTQKTPKEIVREHQHAISRSIRALQREQWKLENSQSAVIADIKRFAGQNQISAARIAALNLVRVRRQVAELYKMQTQLQGVKSNLTSLESMVAITEAMRGATRALVSVGRLTNIQSVQRMASEFAKQMNMMDVNQEMLGDVVDGAITQSGDDEAADELVDKVFDELGLEVESKLAPIPGADPEAFVRAIALDETTTAAAPSAARSRPAGRGEPRQTKKKPPGNNQPPPAHPKTNTSRPPENPSGKTKPLPRRPDTTDPDDMAAGSSTAPPAAAAPANDALPADEFLDDELTGELDQETLARLAALKKP